MHEAVHFNGDDRLKVEFLGREFGHSLIDEGVNLSGHLGDNLGLSFDHELIVQIKIIFPGGFLFLSCRRTLKTIVFFPDPKRCLSNLDLVMSIIDHKAVKTDFHTFWYQIGHKFSTILKLSISSRAFVEYKILIIINC